MKANPEYEQKQERAADRHYLARFLIGSINKHTDHMQQDRDDHGACAPVVHAAHKITEAGLMLDPFNGIPGVVGRVDVVHHQENAGQDLVHEQEEVDEAETELIAHAAR